MSQLVANRAREARAALEHCLDAMGWPPYERALSLAIDRLLQIEENGAAERADALISPMRREGFARLYRQYRNQGCRSTVAAARARQALDR